VGSTFDLTIEGEGFDAGSRDQVFKANGEYMGSGQVVSQSPHRLVVRESMAGAAPGQYTVKVKNSSGQVSNGVTLTLRSEVTISPRSGDAGTSFAISGRGFTGSYGVTSWIRRPDGSETGRTQIGTDPSGRFTRRIHSSGFASGTYEAYTVDDATGMQANRVSFTVSGPAPSSPPRITRVSPRSELGSEFTMTIEGSGFDPQGAVDRVYQPSGQYMGSGVVLSRSSTRLEVRQSMAGAAPTSYTVRVRNPNGDLSNSARFSLYAEVRVRPSNGAAGTLFRYTGEGFTGNYGVSSHLRRPDGSEFSVLQIPTDGRGRFTHTINSSGFAPGTYEVWAEDNNTHHVTRKATFRVE
jgi:hypothetical protein